MSNKAGVAGVRWASLHYLLPALIISLLAVLIGAGSFLAYSEVRTASLARGEEQLERVSGRLAEVLERTTSASLARHARVAEHPAVRNAIGGGAGVDRSLLARELDALRSDGSTLPVELWDSAGAVVFRLGEYPPDWSPDEAAEARSIVAGADTQLYGPLFLVDARPYAWISVPVLDRDGRRVGRLARLGAFNNVNADEIAALIDSAAEIFLCNISGGPWVTLDGEVREPSSRRVFDHTVTHTRGDGETYLARGAAIGGTPLAVVAEAPFAAVMARPAVFLRGLWVGALLLLLAGAVGAWMVSRKITRPLDRLSAAAHDIAAGDYARRVHISSRNELGDVARAFSHMAAEVQSTHSALQAQYEEARDLASSLEITNKRLVEAIVEGERARSEAEVASRAKSDFMAMMSHEVRTPINGIIGYAELLQMELAGPLTPKQKVQLERLTVSSRHLLKLVSEVLDLASVESGNLDLTMDNAGALESLQTAIAIAGPELAAKGVLLWSPRPETDPLFHGDRARVQQILINLISNAGKFTPSGGRVEVAVEADDERVRFIVTDTGPGIPAELQERIFDPFVQADSGRSRAHGGAGLGLAISARLASMMGGEITVESEPGRGARFTLDMPRAHAKAGAESA